MHFLPKPAVEILGLRKGTRAGDADLEEAETISFIAYASSTDNTTGDGWVSLASGDYASSDLDFFGL